MVLGGRHGFTTHSGYNFIGSGYFYCYDSVADEAASKIKNI